MFYLYFLTIDNKIICMETEDYPTYYGETEVLFKPIPNTITVFSYEVLNTPCIAGFWLYHRDDEFARAKFTRNLADIQKARYNKMIHLLQKVCK